MFFFFHDTATFEIYTLSLHDALPIYLSSLAASVRPGMLLGLSCLSLRAKERSEEHTSELQSLTNLVCRLLLEKKKVIESLDLHLSGRAVVHLRDQLHPLATRIARGPA